MNTKTGWLKYAVIVLLALVTLASQSALAQTVTKTPHVESSSTPYVKRTAPIKRDRSKDSKITTDSSVFRSLSTESSSVSLSTLAVTAPTNLVINPSLETPGTNGNPANWARGGYGANTAVYTYPVAGNGDASAIKVDLTAHQDGDAKWYFDPVTVSAGTYTYTDQYISDVPTVLTARLTNTDGTYTYKWLKSLSPAAAFTNATVDFTVDATVKAVTVYHIIQSVGSLTVDNVSVVSKTTPPPPPPAPNPFPAGAVTLRFDDGNLSQYKTAWPKMKTAGFKGTFYITSRQIFDEGFSGYMSKAQVRALYTAGNEIGAHTRTHPALTTLTGTALEDEVAGSKADLLSWNVGPINSFAYPYGDYNLDTISAVINAGFTSATATIDGFASVNSDRYQIEHQSIEWTTTLAQVKTWVNSAVTNKKWLILTFHEISNVQDDYGTTPKIFNSIVDYLKTKKVPVITVSQGAASLK